MYLTEYSSKSLEQNTPRRRKRRKKKERREVISNEN